MACVKVVVGAFADAGKAGQAVLLPDGRKARIAAGQKLMGVALMAYVPDDGVLGTGEDPVERDRQFDGPEVACKVAAIFSNRLDDDRAQLAGKELQA